MTPKDEDYIGINRHYWNTSTSYHKDSEFYDVPGFLAGKSSLNQIELDLLGDISGKTVLHLQCHFGMDTLSLERLGARPVGIDFSEKAIEEAQHLADKAGLTSRFICSEVYNLPNILENKFDIVFTSYGVIGWLPDLNRWARVINHFLKIGGAFVMAEFHPVLWMLDDAFETITYSYFNKETIMEITNGTYASPEGTVREETISWNHSLADVIQPLLDQKLILEQFQEYDYSPFKLRNDMIDLGDGRYQLKAFPDKMPLVFAMSARKKH